MIFSCLKVEEGDSGGVLVDDFKGHSTEIIKDCVKSAKSGDEHDDDECCCELVYFYIVGCGTIPQSQPLDSFLGKIIKGYYRDACDLCIIFAKNPMTRHPFMTIHQLCATWFFTTWGQVPEALMWKSCFSGNYKSYEDFQNQSNDA